MICSNIFLVSKDLNIKHFTKIVRYLFIYAWHTLYRSGFETECTLLPRDKHVFYENTVYTGLYSNLQVLFLLCVQIVRLLFKLNRFNLISFYR